MIAPNVSPKSLLLNDETILSFSEPESLQLQRTQLPVQGGPRHQLGP